jgi:DNA mismatch endonuclease, patch repair protein
MMDVHEPEVRSYNMSRIRCKNTKPELLVRKFLFKNGFRYRLHVKELPGKPDIVLPKFKTVIFINGCFWHGHTNCKYFKLPNTRRLWWKTKIQNTIANDDINMELLTLRGWHVITIFECELKGNLIKTTLEKMMIVIKDEHTCS